MNKLYNLLLKSKYSLEHFYSYKSYTFKLVDGKWEKIVTISKYGVKYVVDGFEGLSNCIKTFKCEFRTYKEVVKYLGI